MTVLKLVPSNDPILKQKISNFDFDNPPVDPIQLANDLIETMIANKGLGLSANQCGLPYRVFVMWSNPSLVCFNPKLVDTSSEQVLMDEGCLSYPGMFIKIKRAQLIKARYTDATGETHTSKFTGMSARVFQHEQDHLDGVNYHKRANLYHLQQAQRKRKKLANANFVDAGDRIGEILAQQNINY